ncbi:MAG: A/G-specific adenine glycosylase [Deltaproteobacteria bacterium]|nr:A/G-specific adenine glycosylase [Deltaproteobacteria bacterium]
MRPKPRSILEMNPASKINQIRRRLLRWYDKNRRALPWRDTQDPYAIWVIETMLQQTQVKTALPYYLRFLTAFPTISSLDRAPLDRVLALWSGLGYYRRAQNLKKAARKIMREHKGKLPQDYHALLTLPGVGPYTAGAVMSIAFNQPFPALDGNTRRVLARSFNTNREKDLQEIDKRLVSPSRPGDFNQALMELGATICHFRDPTCPACPLASTCIAKSSGIFPSQIGPARGRKVKNIEWPLALIQNNGKILLHRRDQNGLLEGLWEIPGGERKARETVKATLARHLKGLGQRARPVFEIGEIRHSITYRRIRASLFFFPGYRISHLPNPDWRWVAISSLRRYPLSSLSLKAIKLYRPRGLNPRGRPKGRAAASPPL